MNLPKITIEDNCFYLSQDISGLKGYEKAKAIVDFCDKETKKLEKEIDRAIIDIFNKNGITIESTRKSVLKGAFDTLNRKGKKITIVDLYSSKLYGSRIIRITPSFHIVLDNDEILECGVMLGETEI